MNAYELADFIDKYCEDNTSKEAAVLLRQQADRIAELEKESANLEQSLKNALVFIDKNKQTKPLSDEEIQKMWKGNVESCGWESVFQFARAIEERHGIK